MKKCIKCQHEFTGNKHLECPICGCESTYDIERGQLELSSNDMYDPEFNERLDDFETLSDREDRIYATNWRR